MVPKPNRSSVDVDNGDDEQPVVATTDADVDDDLRIVSLIPSATDICVHLGLGRHVVGITHCCDRDDLSPECEVVTRDMVHAAENSQGDIHDAVVANGEKAAAAEAALGDDRSEIGEIDDESEIEIPTLYPIDCEILRRVRPNLIVTQDLCHVCAPSSRTVIRALRRLGIDNEVKMVLLTPMNLGDVLRNLREVADAAGIPDTGARLSDELRTNLELLRSTVRDHLEEKEKLQEKKKKRVLIMEWVDPPFCGGHWIPDMAELIGTELAIDPTPEGRSRRITWEEIRDSDPDVSIVACCGFDADRCFADASACSESFRTLRCHRTGDLYAANGDQYFARPSPKLLTGAVVMALCVYREDDYRELARSIRSLPFAAKALDAYRRMDFSS